MGSIRARNETRRLFFEFRYRGKRCREQTALEDTPANRRKMEQVLKKIEAEITLGQFDYLAYFPNSKTGQKLVAETVVAAPPTLPPAGSRQLVRTEATDEDVDCPTFDDFAKQWLMENEVRWRKSTLELQQSFLSRHLIPAFGERKVNSITKAEVLSFRSKLAKVPGHHDKLLSAKTINEIVGSLKAILDEAADRYEFTSPTERIKRLKVQKKDIHPFSLEQVRLILENVREDYHCYMTVRFFTGMRSGELHGLKWKYIDFERRQILIRETFTKGRVEYTKTDGSQREIRMSEAVYMALKKQEAATRRVSEYVFCNRLGQPLDNKNFTDRVWYPLLRYLGLAIRRPYQTRHTAATLWLASGESPEWIATQLGHTSTEMLFRVYSRYVPNLTRQDGSAFEKMLGTTEASALEES
ncbi:site-specific integrase [Spongiibacter nanhainus]|uniref:Site-specific integrase n=1 Tax=Spongiibacter nanhainus TaxID=2794344 RepID=A0A7T4QYT4_9GAMM|nr:site-specific integrase [Spongiibacter nanhainus]QQD17295.1 site-specific integrase [Spongiibacter nanhainus]